LRPAAKTAAWSFCDVLAFINQINHRLHAKTLTRKLFPNTQVSMHADDFRSETRHCFWATVQRQRGRQTRSRILDWKQTVTKILATVRSSIYPSIGWGALRVVRCLLFILKSALLTCYRLDPERPAVYRGSP